jgi:hypothetical protein
MATRRTPARPAASPRKAKPANPRSSAAKRKAGAGEVIAEAGAPLVEAASTVDPASAVKAAFEADDGVQAILADNYSSRTRAARPNAKKADDAFKRFRPSRVGRTEKQRGTYLAPGESLTATLGDLVRKGVDARRDTGSRASLKVHLTDEVRGLVTEASGGSGAGTLVLTDVINLLNIKFAAPPSLGDDATRTICSVTKEVQSRMDAIEGKPPEAAGASHDGSQPGDAAPPDSGVPSHNGDHEPARIADFVTKHVHSLMAHTPAPEEQPTLTPAKRAALDLDGLKLSAGPSDVTSYHDFNSLQIAFEHVWAEVFDARLGQLGRELYETYIGLLQTTDYRTNPIKSVTSIEDIKTLMGHAAELGRAADNSTPGNSQPGFDLFKAIFGGREEPSKTTPSSGLELTLPSVKRLTTLLEEIDKLLQQPYAFTVFQKNSSNFGIMVTYRQKWVPESYQVGDLVKTIPLAPREIRRYTTRQVTKKSRTTKEIENNLQARRSGADDTSRVDREIVSRAENRTNFKATADGSFGTDAWKVHATGEAGGDTAKMSQDTKRNFREAVLRSAQEYKHDNRLEVETTSSEEFETTSYNEITNPNDELTVTYLFYELQRTYHISEKIHQVVPVVLVANEVPRPDAIDDAWLIKHDWILRRVLLDDSFKPALDYLTKSFVGDELNLQVLDNNARAQRQVVDAVKAQVAAQVSIVEAAQRDLNTKMDAKGGLEFTEGILQTVKRVFDPFQITGSTVTGTKEGMDTVANYAQEVFDRAQREKMRLLDQLELATTALQAAIDKLSAAIREHFDKVAEIDRLRVHVKENILYYMQAIWNHEPPDQRYFRIFEVKVPIVKPKTTNVAVAYSGHADRWQDSAKGDVTIEVPLPFPDIEIDWKPLVEVADLDEVLGYKGNYAIYRLKENNYLTYHMMQDYLELSDDVKIRDPDDFANCTVDELQQLATCLYQHDRDAYKRHKVEIQKMIIDRLMSGRPEDDRVIVPTQSLYIEALPGTHPLLEEFKLLHRALDVKKVQGEVRHAELENLRLAARALKGKDEDPDIEKKILVETEGSGIVVGPD